LHVVVLLVGLVWLDLFDARFGARLALCAHTFDHRMETRGHTPVYFPFVTIFLYLILCLSADGFQGFENVGDLKVNANVGIRKLKVLLVAIIFEVDCIHPDFGFALLR
jgi:hypothetical protein